MPRVVLVHGAMDRSTSFAKVCARLTALDEIARRIREGDLSVPAGPMTDPATVAATLAALLGVKR